MSFRTVSDLKRKLKAKVAKHGKPLMFDFRILEPDGTVIKDFTKPPPKAPIVDLCVTPPDPLS